MHIICAGSRPYHIFPLPFKPGPKGPVSAGKAHKWACVRRLQIGKHSPIYWACELRQVVYGLLCMAHGIWSIVNGLSFTACRLRPAVYGLLNMARRTAVCCHIERRGNLVHLVKNQLNLTANGASNR